MILKSTKLKAKPEEGDYNTVKRFAWWPVRVGDSIIWLEKYKIVYQYTIRERAVYCQGYGIIDKIVCGGWDFVTKQLNK